MQQLFSDWGPHDNEIFSNKFVDPVDLKYMLEFQTAINQQHGDKLLEQIAKNMSILERAAAELFRREVGLTPKRFCRIRRFQQVLRELQTRKEIRWADVACAGGYYDQESTVN